jgi:hypothetical protein
MMSFDFFNFWPGLIHLHLPTDLTSLGGCIITSPGMGQPTKRFNLFTLTSHSLRKQYVYVLSKCKKKTYLEEFLIHCLILQHGKLILPSCFVFQMTSLHLKFLQYPLEDLLTNFPLHRMHHP